MAEQARQIKAERAGIESQDEGLKTPRRGVSAEVERLKAEEAEIARQQQHLQAQRVAALTGMYRKAADRFDNLCAKQDDSASSKRRGSKSVGSKSAACAERIAQVEAEAARFAAQQVSLKAQRGVPWRAGQLEAEDAARREQFARANNSGKLSAPHGKASGMSCKGRSQTGTK